jgi:hypothetical protein
MKKVQLTTKLSLGASNVAELRSLTNNWRILPKGLACLLLPPIHASTRTHNLISSFIRSCNTATSAIRAFVGQSFLTLVFGGLICVLTSAWQKARQEQPYIPVAIIMRLSKVGQSINISIHHANNKLLMELNIPASILPCQK